MELRIVKVNYLLFKLLLIVGYDRTYTMRSKHRIFKHRV